jgi:hypothetical protein
MASGRGIEPIAYGKEVKRKLSGLWAEKKG